MARLVRDRGGRPWSVRSRAHLAGSEATALPADAALRAVLLGVSALLVLAVLHSTPTTLWLPGWVAGPVLVVAAASVAGWGPALPQLSGADSSTCPSCLRSKP